MGNPNEGYRTIIELKTKMQSFLVNDNNLWVKMFYIFSIVSPCFLSKRNAFLSMEMPQIQI